MKTLNKQQGFTLVELIIVIVILGILAVTAAPRFLNFQGDAKASVLSGVQGSLKAAISLVNGKALISSQNTTALACFENNVVRPATPAEIAAAPVAPLNKSCLTGVDITYGSPDADVSAIEAVVELPEGFVVHDVQSGAALTDPLTVTAGTVVMAASLADLDAGNCLVRYTEATASAEAKVEIENADACE